MDFKEDRKNDKQQERSPENQDIQDERIIQSRPYFSQLYVTDINVSPINVPQIHYKFRLTCYFTVLKIQYTARRINKYFDITRIHKLLKF